MPITCFTLALTGTAQKLTAANGGTDVSFRQLLLTATGADGFVGGSGVSSTAGIKIGTAAPMPVSFGPFQSGAVRLSDLYAVGAGSTLQIAGVPY